MPSDMDVKGIQSSSFFSEEILSPNERQIGFWKTQSMLDLNGLKREGAVGRAGGNSVGSLPLETWMSVESKMKSYELAGSYLNGCRRENLGLEKHAVGAERAARHSMQRAVDCGPGTIYHPTTKGDGVRAASAQYTNGFFSSSFSEAFNELKLSSNNDLYGRSFGASQHDEEELGGSLDEIEAQTIGNLLPNDDELLSGVTDGFNYAARPIAGDNEDFDLFSSVGGLDLGDDGLPPRQRSSRRNPDQLGESFSSASGEQPSRTLFVCNIDGNIEDAELQILFEQFGDIQTLHTTCKHRGFVMVSYYDIRAAQNAIRSLQNKQLRNQRLDIQFSIPKESSSEKDTNQGTLVVYNLESSVSPEELRKIFGVYGEIKEVQEIPHKNHQKFIEFYDIRAAEAALRVLDKSVIAGKQIKLEPSRPVGPKRSTRLFPESLQQDGSSTYLQLSQSPVNPPQMFSVSHGGITSFGMDRRTASGTQSIVQGPLNPYVENYYGISNSVPNGSPSLMTIQSVPNLSRLPESGYSQAQPTMDYQTNFHPHSIPDYHDGLTNGSPCNCQGMAVNNGPRPSERVESRPFCRVGSSESVMSSSTTGNFPSPVHNYMWNTSPRPQPQAMMWPNSPTFVNGLCTAQAPSQMHMLPRAPSHMLSTVLPLNNPNVGSAPSVNRSLWERRCTAEAPEASSIHAGSFGNLRSSANSPHRLEFLSPNIFPHAGGNCIDLTMPSKNVGLHSPHHGCLMFSGSPMIPMMTPLDSPNERGSRSHRNDGSSNQADNKKQFDLDLDRIIRGEDKRTTLMIKNIPNKYTSKMLVAAIDERHRGSYDFIYLPIDFKNKCNVGYAFINMVDPSLIIPFYQAFNGKRWEKFNSEKVASLAYARIQGKVALIAHFQNSSLMNEDKRCRPILFNTDGPNAGDQVPFPMGVNVRARPSKARTMSSDDIIHKESKPDVLIDEKSSYGDTSSRSSKDSG